MTQDKLSSDTGEGVGADPSRQTMIRFNWNSWVQFFPITGDRSHTFLSLAILVSLGLLSAWVKSPFAFGFGDHTLFHSFGHWINNGEVFMRDFIHFRTPGPYYYYAGVQSVFGDTFRSTSFALLTEAYVWQVLASFFLALAASKIFWGRASLALAFFVGLIFIFLPPIYQLRTAVPAFALALYLFALAEQELWLQYRYLFWVGIFLGISYWFGQEIFIFLALSILAAECAAPNLVVASIFHRVVRLFLGAAVSVLPGLLALFLSGVDIAQYLYNTTYYAFVIQPKGMDIPFPSLTSKTLVFYVWFWVLTLAVVIFSLCRTLFAPAAVVFVSYACLRMISALGRADFLHLLFAISEVVVILPIAVGLFFRHFNSPLSINVISRNHSDASAGEKRSRPVLFGVEMMMYKPNILINHKLLIPSIALGLFVWIIFLIGMKGRSSILLIIPFVIALFCYFVPKILVSIQVYDRWDESRSISRISASTISFVCFFSVLLFTHPHSINSFKGSIDAISSPIQAPVLGVQLSPANGKEVDVVKRFIAERGATNIFSYPLRTEFYALVPAHGTRFVEFAPQMTPKDIAGAISDLKRSRPMVVIRDLDQVALFSPALHELSDFISSNYRSVKIELVDNKLELMELRNEVVPMRRLFDQVYKFNQDRSHVTAGVRSGSDGSVSLVLAINKGEGIFKFAPGPENVLQTSIYAEPGTSSVGEIEIRRGNHRSSHRVNVEDGVVQIEIPSGDDELEIRLSSADRSKSILWTNPKIVHFVPQK